MNCPLVIGVSLANGLLWQGLLKIRLCLVIVVVLLRHLHVDVSVPFVDVFFDVKVLIEVAIDFQVLHPVGELA